jgi:lipopolysaccharide export system ATP-binding protein
MPNDGKILINGQDVTKFPIYLRTKKFKVGYVPQYGGFFNDMTLLDNLKAISEIVIEDKNARQNKIDYLITKFELENIKMLKQNFYLEDKRKNCYCVVFIERS